MAAPKSMEPTTAIGTSRLGLRASPASWAACSKPSRAKMTPSGMATNKPLKPYGMNAPPALKFEEWKTFGHDEDDGQDRDQDLPVHGDGIGAGHPLDTEQ